jgi:hypothetical protein
MRFQDSALVNAYAYAHAVIYAPLVRPGTGLILLLVVPWPPPALTSLTRLPKQATLGSIHMPGRTFQA